MKLSEEDLKSRHIFTEGVHAVTITEATFEKNANDEVFLNVKVQGTTANKAMHDYGLLVRQRLFLLLINCKIFAHNAKR